MKSLARRSCASCPDKKDLKNSDLEGVILFEVGRPSKEGKHGEERERERERERVRAQHER